MPILAYLCLFRLINLFPPPIFLLLPLQTCSFFWVLNSPPLPPFLFFREGPGLGLSILHSPFSRFSLVENNRAPSELRILHSQFSILHSQFSILNSPLPLPSGCNGCSMDDEWVPNGCSLGAPFTVLVRKLFFMFFRRTRIWNHLQRYTKKINYPNFGSRKCTFS